MVFRKNLKGNEAYPISNQKKNRDLYSLCYLFELR